METRKVKFRASSPLSLIIFFSLKELYFTELKKVLSGNLSRNKLHGYSNNSITAFPIAGSVWEAILNEQFTSDFVSSIYKNNILFDIQEEADRWDIKTKSIMYPKFLFGRTFDSSKGFYSDFTSLVQIRNNIVHYKHSLYEGPDKAIKNLRIKKVTYPKPNDVDCPWHMELFSTECIRFCINTICEFVQTLSELETKLYKEQCMPINTIFYEPITDEQVIDVFKEFDIDPTSIEKDFFQNTSLKQ